MVSTVTDDPAITACEAAVSTIGPDETYKRIDAAIENLAVKINYEIKQGRDRPEQKLQTCWFRYDAEKGDFLFAPRPLDSRCGPLLERPSEVWDREMLRTCIALESAIGRQFELLQAAVKGLGIYPIKAKDTKLGRSQVQ